jgi:hypothetical protein
MIYQTRQQIYHSSLALLDANNQPVLLYAAQPSGTPWTPLTTTCFLRSIRQAQDRLAQDEPWPKQVTIDISTLLLPGRDIS